MKISILGAGAYGLALASIFNKNGHEVTIWSHSKIETKQIKTTRKSDKLKDYEIPKK